MKQDAVKIKMEYVGAFKPEHAEKLFKQFDAEQIEYFGEEDQSVHEGNSPFTQSPGGSTEDEIQKVFVHNRDIKKAISIANELFNVNTENNLH